MRNTPSVIASWVCALGLCHAQNQPFTIQRPTMPIPIRSYMAPVVPPIRLNNSGRLYSLIRAGNLYLSVPDALALAIENNLSLEVDRYGPLLAESALNRAKAGGPFRGVPPASAQVGSVDSGLGVNGTVQSAGLNTGGGSRGGVGGGGTSIQQVGAITPNLDPVLQNTTTIGHLSQPQSNTIQSQTNALVQSVHTYNSVVTQGLLTGGSLVFVDYEQYLKENSPSDNLNPAVGPHMDLQFRQNLLQGFGPKLNDRTIRISQINTTASREVFRSRLLNLVVSVLNLYWDLVSARDDVKLRQHALEITQKFYDDTKYEISIGAIPAIQLTRAEAELASRRQDVVIARSMVQQRAILLKAALTHTEDAALEAAEIIPLDGIEVPETEDLPPLRQLVAAAVAKRPDVAVSKFRDQTDEINLAGTANPLLPTLQMTALTYNRGVSGSPQNSGANPYFVGGYGTAVGQIFRRDFPNNQANAYLYIPFGNRQAQGDYGIDQLQFRQSQLQGQKDTNQIVVDIASQMTALTQAHARYSTARDTRILQEQLLAADQKRASGVATFNIIMADQRALIAAQIAELNARTACARARVSLDQVLGETLEANNISLEEGLRGHVERESRIPEIGQTGQK